MLDTRLSRAGPTLILHRFYGAFKFGLFGLFGNINLSVILDINCITC